MRIPNFALEYHLVDSCNLNCAGCSHYSSLVDKQTYKPINTIINDLTLLKDKVGDKLPQLRLLGGEPLLHPQLCDCLIKIRELFPITLISLVTNGLLLEKMPKVFYDTCSNCNIKIRITNYNLIDLDSVINKLKEYGIFASQYKQIKDWRYQDIRLTEGRIDCFTRCHFKYICNNYRDGKIYLCPHIAYIDYFNKFFKKNIELDDTDYISLDDVASFDDLIQKLDSAKPNFCYQYCNCYDKEHPTKGKWKTTDYNIDEFCLT